MSRLEELKAMRATAVENRDDRFAKSSAYAREATDYQIRVEHLDIAIAALEAKGSGPTGGGDDGGTISLDRSEFTGHPNAPKDESGSSTASFDLDSLSPEERQEMIDRAVGDEAEQERACQAFEEQEATDYEAVRDRAGEVMAVKATAERFAAFEMTQDAGGYAPVTEADEQNSVYGTEAAYNDGVEARIQNIPVECNPCEGADAAAWADGWAEADVTITLAELDNESADILTDPDLQAKADEMRATLAAGTLVDPELDRELEAARKREGVESRSFWPFGGKLVGA